MILVFQDDGSMRVIDSVAEANREYEAIDVENQEYTFLDERGLVLKPVLREPATKKWLFFFSIIDTGPFTFEQTEGRRDDLIARLRSGDIPLDRRSSGIRTLDDLRKKAPELFRA
jgi:hypothetical protein